MEKDVTTPSDRLRLSLVSFFYKLTLFLSGSVVELAENSFCSQSESFRVSVNVGQTSK